VPGCEPSIDARLRCACNSLMLVRALHKLIDSMVLAVTATDDRSHHLASGNLGDLPA
jgi:hypothetical protein